MAGFVAERCTHTGRATVFDSQYPMNRVWCWAEHGDGYFISRMSVQLRLRNGWSHATTHATVAAIHRAEDKNNHVE